MQKRIIIIFAVLSVLTIIVYALILNPTVQEKVGWHLNQWIIRARVWLNPPEKIAFSSETDGTPDPELLPSPNVDERDWPDEAPRSKCSAQPPTFAPIPDTFEIVRGEYFSQHNRWNYCGPANIAMLLSIWGWEGTHDEAARAIKPYKLDKNVMPYEMEAYAEQQPGLGALVRVGGDFETLKRLIAAGFPVLLKKARNSATSIITDLDGALPGAERLQRPGRILHRAGFIHRGQLRTAI